MRSVNHNTTDDMKLQKGNKCNERLHNAILLWDERSTIVITKKRKWVYTKREMYTKGDKKNVWTPFPCCRRYDGFAQSKWTIGRLWWEAKCFSFY